MKVALYGIGGLYNYGCEAIARGAVSLFGRAFPDAEITYWSYRAADDALRLADLPILVKQVQKRDDIVIKTVNKFLQLAQTEFRFLRFDWKPIIDASDAIISIGGDIYTIPKHLRSNESYQYYSPLVQFGERCKMAEKIFCVYGASIGPFGNMPKAIEYYRRHFESLDLIMAREKSCVDYLSCLGINENVVFVPDPIFAIQKPRAASERRRMIGVNVSPLSFHETFGNVDKFVEKTASWLDELIRRTDHDLLLVPHVMSDNEIDNDYIFMNNIRNHMLDCGRARTKIVQPTCLAEANAFLNECAIVVAARMHCALNAVTSGVPAIFLSYSEKSRGMARLVYGNENWIAPIEDLTSAIAKAEELIRQRTHIERALNERVRRLQKESLSDKTVACIREKFKVQDSNNRPNMETINRES